MPRLQRCAVRFASAPPLKQFSLSAVQPVKNSLSGATATQRGAAHSRAAQPYRDDLPDDEGDDLEGGLYANAAAVKEVGDVDEEDLGLDGLEDDDDDEGDLGMGRGQYYRTR